MKEDLSEFIVALAELLLADLEKDAALAKR